jgi:hypothetical protein
MLVASFCVLFYYTMKLLSVVLVVQTLKTWSFCPCYPSLCMCLFPKKSTQPIQILLILRPFLHFKKLVYGYWTNIVKANNVFVYFLFLNTRFWYTWPKQRRDYMIFCISCFKNIKFHFKIKNYTEKNLFYIYIFIFLTKQISFIFIILSQTNRAQPNFLSRFILFEEDLFSINFLVCI